MFSNTNTVLSSVKLLLHAILTLFLISLPTATTTAENSEPQTLKQIKIDQFKYKIYDSIPNQDSLLPEFDDSQWELQHAGYGQQFWKLGPMNYHEATYELDTKILKATQFSSKRGFLAKWRNVYWEPYYFSWEEGSPSLDLGSSTDSFNLTPHKEMIVLGKLESTEKELKITEEPQGTIYFLRSAILVDEDCSAQLKMSDYAPSYIWISGEQISLKEKTVQLKKGLKKYTDKHVDINIAEIKQPDMDATLVAENIAAQLERRVAFRRAMKQAVSRTIRMGAKGIKVTVGGRLGGAEIARSESYREGSIPLHTLRADIDYGTAEAHTTYGRLGVKVWIFKGEVLPEKKTAVQAETVEGSED